VPGRHPRAAAATLRGHSPRDEAWSARRGRPLDDPEREGPGRDQRAQKGRPRLQQAPAAGGALGDAVLPQVAAPGREPVAGRLQRVPERHPVEPGPDVSQPRLLELGRERGRLVAAEVADRLVHRAVPRRPRGRGHEQGPSRPQPPGPRAQCGVVVLDVLDDLEGADEVETVPVDLLERPVEPGGLRAGGSGALARDGDAGRVQLDAGVVVASRQPDPDGTLPAADLEHPRSRCRERLVHDPGDDVPSQPREGCQWRQWHGGLRCGVVSDAVGGAARAGA